MLVLASEPHDQLTSLPATKPPCVLVRTRVCYEGRRLPPSGKCAWWNPKK